MTVLLLHPASDGEGMAWHLLSWLRCGHSQRAHDSAPQEESAAELLLATEELLRKLNSNKASPLPPDGYLSDEDTGPLPASSFPCLCCSATLST